MSRLEENLAEVRQRVADAARRSGRRPSEIEIVAVTKYVDAALAGELADRMRRAGLPVSLGESRPQELWRKAASLPAPDIRWHLIGHLQRNKIDRTLPLVSLLHSINSLRLAEAISAEAVRASLEVPALLEVNISGDASKHGFRPDELPPVIEQIGELPCLRVLGLMTMAGREGDLDDARRDFAQLRQLRDRLRRSSGDNIELNALSMGMSGDYQVAIEEGATIVRIGSALFEGVAE